MNWMISALKFLLSNEENLKFDNGRGMLQLSPLEYVACHLYSFFTSLCRSMLYAIFILFFISLHTSVINNKINKGDKPLSVIIDNNKEETSDNKDDNKYTPSTSSYVKSGRAQC